ncbi:MAG: DEAD/DEAH box helicase [Archaeoglobus sp.]|nr:DEAD/DEAH box helicase [Archaeoglobus sp.]
MQTKQIIESLKEALKEAGISQLSELQKRAFDAIARRRDVLIIAPAGTGKTEAAIIPILYKMLKLREAGKDPEGIYLLYITPLRALNRDMLRRISILAKKLGLSIAVRHGDTADSERKKQSRKPPQILITTPETLQILFQGIKLRNVLRNVRYVVVDEIHEMVDSERGVQLSVGLERLRELTNFNLIGLSATVRKEDVSSFFLSEPLILLDEERKKYEFTIVKPEVRDEDEVLAEQLNIEPEVAAELRFIKEIVESHTSTLIFVNTRQTAEALGVRLKKMIDVEVHHGSLSKDARIEAEKRFVEGELKALICTSSMELGIDIGHVDVVIQFNSPREVSRLLQRVGRSGHRKEETSKGYIICRSFDDILESWVIARKALRNEIESLRIHRNSLDTLANQISALALEYKRIDVERAYSIIKRSFPFRDLQFEDFLAVCEFLANGNVIFFDGEWIKPRRKTRNYFYDNISMIPDEKSYRVVDITTGKTIGSLDESFLSTFSGEVFAIKGELWRVLAVDDVVKVEPVVREGEIPSWVGEEIPVPYEVAIEVGGLRREIGEMLKRGNVEELIKELKTEYNTNSEAVKTVVETIDEQLKKGFSIPSDKLISVESAENVAVINCCFGHRVNETLGRIVALLLSARKGRNVGIEVDPYRIKLSPASAIEVMEILNSISPESVETLAERALLETKLLQWKVIHSARKFGYLSKDFDLSRINVRKLVLKLRDTPIYREAVREIFVEKMDVERTSEIISKLEREIEIETYDTLSPIGLASREHAFDLLMPSKPIEALLRIFKERLQREVAMFHCLNCKYTIKTPIRLIKELRCPKCNSGLIACFNARRRLEEIPKKELHRIANLVLSHGMKAVLALNTHGVGAENAARILSKYYENDDKFYLELMEAERRYIRTRGFWD